MIRTVLLATCSAFAISTATPDRAVADPITAAVGVAALSTASSVITAGGIASFTFLGLAPGLASIAASFAVRAGLGIALNALSTNDDSNQSRRVNRGYKINALGSALPRQVIYGKTRVGGAVFYQKAGGSANEYLHRCIAFAGHEIESYETIYINDDAVELDGSGNVTSPAKYAGWVRIKQFTGTAAQSADSDLVNDVGEWTTDHRARGVAYLYVRFRHDQSDTAKELWVNGVPTISAIIKGKKVYDPRSDTTAWSDNPALCLRDYLISDYGLDDVSANMDEDLFTEAANTCDQTLYGGKRYTCNGAFLLDASPANIIRAITSSMGGIFWFLHGKWAVRAAAYNPPEFSFNEDDLRSSIQIATRHSRRDNFNTVRGVYRGPETFYAETDYTEVSEAEYVTEDGGVVVTTDLPLIFTDTDAECQRIALIALRRNRLQKTITATFGIRALAVRIGDTIKFSNSKIGWIDEIFECVDWRFGLSQDMGIEISMVLREINQAVFDSE